MTPRVAIRNLSFLGVILGSVVSVPAAQLKEAETASLGQLIERRVIQDLPLNGRMLIDMNSHPDRGITDGVRVDVKGNLWETGPGGVWIITPEGKHIGTIKTPELAANVCTEVGLTTATGKYGSLSALIKSSLN